MTGEVPQRSTASRALRRVLRPAVARLDALRGGAPDLQGRTRELAARIDQLSRQVERLEAYQQVSRDEVEREFASLTTDLSGTSPDQTPGQILQGRLDHALLHAEALTEETRAQFRADLAELRSTVRLAQALAEQARAASPAPASGAAPSATPPAATSSAAEAVPAPRSFKHPVPSFDLLYRAFEDRHRGDAATIRDRQRDDYLEVLAELPNPELPVVDLGCGRGELVHLLVAEGHAALGVDSNLGQVVDGDPTLFVQDDLFAWMDRREDSSVRAVLSMHVVEHLPLDLQVRLVFEARRILAPGGLLVIETPNALSLSTAATNFWVDPTHQRPVHPLFLEFLAEQAGFGDVHTEPLHELSVSFRGAEEAPDLVDDLNSLILGAGDLALFARR